MHCVREKKGASNIPVRERRKDLHTRVREDVRSRHIGNRGQYNGKRLGTNYTGGKHNSSASFMFFNFPEEWGMGNLWMIFKKYGTVFDMFMVRKRLRNGQRYGFVRFKHVNDVEELLRRLRNIRIGVEYIKVFVAFNRRNLDDGSRRNSGEAEVRHKRKLNNGFNGEGVKMGTCDNRSYVDVVHGVNNVEVTTKANIAEDEKNQDNKGMNFVDVGVQGDVRMVEVEENEINSEIFQRSLIGEVKKMCYLTKLPEICEEQGLHNVEIKVLGGLEVMMIFDKIETATNVLRNIEHGLRRWVYKLRKWNCHYRSPGRLTWINIIGVPVSCWVESVFLKIAALHGAIIGMQNCKLEGNQNIIVGRVHVHTVNKGLIKEDLNIKIRGKMFKVNVTEEECGSGEDSNSEGDKSEDEEQYEVIVKGGGSGCRPPESCGRNIGEDEQSRYTSETRVCDSFEEENVISKEKVTVVNSSLHGNCNERVCNQNNCGAQKNEVNESQDLKNNTNVYDNSTLKCDGLDGLINVVQEGSGLLKEGIDNNHIDNMAGPNINNRVSMVRPSDTGLKNNDTDEIKHMEQQQQKQEVIQDHILSHTRGEKRMISPSNSSGRAPDGSRKKMRKASSSPVLEGVNLMDSFNLGLGEEGRNSSKRKIGRRVVTKDTEVPRHTGVEGVGEDNKGISVIYKEYHEEEDANSGVFVFRGVKHVESERHSCNISVEQVKEIGEMIGVSWVKAEGEVRMEKSVRVEEEIGVGVTGADQEGIGEIGKKGWVNSIIRDERPDIIGLQETKSGLVDDDWVEDIWGGGGFGFTQLPANGNSGGILLVWDKRVFTCKEAMGDDRFIAVKGEWKGKNKDIYLVCVYGPHVGRQKTSLWERLAGLMNRFSGAWCIFGDLNVVRRNEDRLNSQLNDLLRIIWVGVCDSSSLTLESSDHLFVFSVHEIVSY
ncbi:hypothetical protein CTI12_AA448820 [Artemisia annua]|uniref:RRM domain-containing protein n=1 Tax=Artemisia annua TaxID=35608 RepID=A0A2U1LVP6_ARTAN|nr:hypothetical protein CTI12_AA448820 [Artemisia annua]